MGSFQRTEPCGEARRQEVESRGCKEYGVRGTENIKTELNRGYHLSSLYGVLYRRLKWRYAKEDAVVINAFDMS